MPFQVVIAGAGPAGALSAFLLAAARPDWRILLIDAEPLPKHRPCGEYLSPGAVGVLARAGLASAVMATGAQSLAGVAISGACGGMDVAFAPVLGRAPCHAHGLGIRRERFDAVLQDAAALRVALRRATRITRAAYLDRRWRLTIDHAGALEDLEADLLIGADGRHSRIRHWAGLDAPSGRKRFALVCRATGIRHGDRVAMHLGPLGQVGVCPLGSGEVNLNLLLAPASTPLLRMRRPETLMRAALSATPTLAGSARRAVLGPVLATGSLAQSSHGVIADGLCLVGDAAGFCDPFSGEGLTLALRGAELLAQSFAEASGHPPVAQLQCYATAYARTIGRRRRFGDALQPVLARRRLSDGLAAVLGRIPLLAAWTIAEASGYRRSARPAA
ncbi:MAG: FAD-dependent monooxygenase [Planctomycetes bacterium]|nr:FAD-dependent monooxygenase [Planctomycetota bacterium]